jgi:predicted small lipoprotein YifL
MNNNKLRRSIIGFFMIFLFTSGCGQKGPLLLPDAKPAANLMTY